MGKIFKNLRPYWKAVILVLVLLVVQAFCDLTLPQYTSNIIDTGIQNGGIEHVLPEKITKEEFALAEVFMTQDEKTDWENAYTEDGDLYLRNAADKTELDALDNEFMVALILNYQMSSVDEETFQTEMAPQLGAAAAQFTEFPADMRPMFSQMMAAGYMTEDSVLQIRDQMQTKFDTLGASLTKSMGIAYAKAMDSKAGIDMDAVQTSYLWSAGFKMLLLALLMAASMAAAAFLAAKIGAGVGRDLRGKIYQNVMGFSNTEINRFSTASLITRSTNDVQQIQMVLTMLLRFVIYAPILGVGGVIKVIETKAGMSWIIALAVLVILGIMGLLMAVAMPKFKLMQKLVDKVNLISREILTGLSVIRAFGREKEEEKRFDAANQELTKTQLFTNRVMTFMMPLMTFIMYGLTVLIVWVAAHKIDAGNLQVGAMTAFITYAMQIVTSFLMMTMLSIMLPRAAVAAERIDEVIETKSSVSNPQQPEKLDQAQGVVAFHHVHFRYPGAEEDALEDIDFTAEPGKTTAIVGSTGCGKSTLVNLIPRLYDVTAGSVTIDGKDIRQVALEDLRELEGFVPQKGILFSGTIASNIRFGRENATDQEVEQAASIAQATEFIEEKGARYESPIAQGGANVSGGQKQRLSIARAIAKNPKIYIFDDSFSALDLKTDAVLRKALAERTQNSTVLIVAQRLSTILHADQILVMEEGRIVGKGTHRELLENCETYQQIARSQLSEKELRTILEKEA